jgi:hypothetical protein
MQERWLERAKLCFKISIIIAISVTMLQITIIRQKMKELDNKVEKIIMFLNLDLDADEEVENE